MPPQRLTHRRSLFRAHPYTESHGSRFSDPSCSFNQAQSHHPAQGFLTDPDAHTFTTKLEDAHLDLMVAPVNSKENLLTLLNRIIFECYGLRIVAERAREAPKKDLKKATMTPQPTHDTLVQIERMAADVVRQCRIFRSAIKEGRNPNTGDITSGVQSNIQQLSSRTRRLFTFIRGRSW